MIARRTEIEIIYEEKEITKNILPYLISFMYKDVASGEADQLGLILMDKDGKWIGDWFPNPKDSISAKIKVINWDEEGDNRTFECGNFVVDDLSFSGRPRTMNLGSLSIPANNGFNDTAKTKTWEKITVKQIATEIARNADIQLHYENEEIQIEKVEQSGQSDMEFLYNVCKDYGLAMKVYKSKIIIFNEMEYEQKSPITTLKERDFISWSGNITIAGIYDGADISYTSSKKGKVYQYSFKPREGERILKINKKADSLDDAQKQAKAELRAKNKQETKLSLVMKGNISIVAGTCVAITDLQKFDGKYYVDEVTHTIKGGFTTKIELHRVLEGGY